jgi:branched-chain amino acid transport system ATP-binding protein
MPTAASLPHGAEATSALDVAGITIRFGGVAALSDVSFSVSAGQACGLIGPNGAGKTTLFNCISGLYAADAGEIRVAGTGITSEPAHRIAKLGVGRTFQNLALFPNLSLLENVLIGTHVRTSAGFVESSIMSFRARREETAARDEALELLKIVGLADRALAKVGGLPFGFQKRVELARALATRPALLLLDEPAAGLNPAELADFKVLIQQIRARFDLTILLVEHHLGLVMELCQKLVVLNFGRKMAEGTPDEVRADPEVIRAYLGDRP